MQELTKARAELKALQDKVASLEREVYEKLLLDMEKADPEDLEAAQKHWEVFGEIPTLHQTRRWGYETAPLNVTPKWAERRKTYFTTDMIESLLEGNYTARDKVATIYNVIRDRVWSFT